MLPTTLILSQLSTSSAYSLSLNLSKSILSATILTCSGFCGGKISLSSTNTLFSLTVILSAPFPQMVSNSNISLTKSQSSSSSSISKSYSITGSNSDSSIFSLTYSLNLFQLSFLTSPPIASSCPAAYSTYGHCFKNPCKSNPLYDLPLPCNTSPLSFNTKAGFIYLLASFCATIPLYFFVASGVT